MTDKLTALRDLRDTVAAGQMVQEIDAIAIWPENGIWIDVCNASQGSFNAALAAHDAVLPGWQWVLFKENGAKFFAEVSDGDWHGEECQADDPARAWLLAIIDALIAQEEQP